MFIFYALLPYILTEALQGTRNIIIVMPYATEIVYFTEILLLGPLRGRNTL